MGAKREDKGMTTYQETIQDPNKTIIGNHWKGHWVEVSEPAFPFHGANGFERGEEDAKGEYGAAKQEIRLISGVGIRGMICTREWEWHSSLRHGRLVSPHSPFLIGARGWGEGGGRPG